ncbi:MAG: hypothetical protein M1820_005431 [Bogoriella megaspora]|nr:MAG: hypothetical protein M1820_005431 [Bogoriella megaspora]
MAPRKTLCLLIDVTGVLLSRPSPKFAYYKLANQFSPSRLSLEKFNDLWYPDLATDTPSSELATDREKVPAILDSVPLSIDVLADGSIVRYPLLEIVPPLSESAVALDLTSGRKL